MGRSPVTALLTDELIQVTLYYDGNLPPEVQSETG
jgi:hypothetical protein